MNLTVHVLHVAPDVVAFNVAQFPHSRLPLQPARLCEDISWHWSPVGFLEGLQDPLPLCQSFRHQSFFLRSRVLFEL